MIYKYTAIPVITKGNLIFPDTIIIDTQFRRLQYIKRSLNVFSKTLSSVPFKSIAEVRLHHRNEYLLFSTICIETYGGRVIKASGFKPEDSKEIKHYLDIYR